MEIRKLTASDHDRATELYSDLDELHVQARPDYFVHREKDATYPKDSYLHNLSDPCFLELGAFDGEQLIGFASAALRNNSGMVKDVKTVFLENIYVSPAYRRRGAAARLFAEVERWAREQGAVRLDLYVWDFNKNAIAMYQALGMTPQRHVLEKKLSD